MEVAIHKGIIKELGPSIQEADRDVGSATYTYIEWTDGRMLRGVGAVGGLIGKLDNALTENGEVELHLLPGTWLRKTQLLLAIRTSEGKVYASDMSFSALPYYLGILFLTFLGIATIWVMGLGLLFLALAWYVWQSLRILKTGRGHVRGLANAVLL